MRCASYVHASHVVTPLARCVRDSMSRSNGAGFQCQDIYAGFFVTFGHRLCKTSCLLLSLLDRKGRPNPRYESPKLSLPYSMQLESCKEDFGAGLG
jgi:hypothetical protein